jgi:chromosome segregation ATPase
MQDSNYEKLQKLLRENAELKAKINEVADRQRAADPDETSSIRSELERLRRQLESNQPEVVQTQRQVPVVTEEELQRLIRENSSLRERAYGTGAGTDPRFHWMSAGDDQLLQRLLRENDELRHRLGDMETRLTKITQLTGTLKLDRDALNASREGSQLRSAMEPSYGGTVTLLKSKGNFAILKFPQGRIPPPRTKLDVFRDGILVGTVQITNPVKPPLASADIISGSLRIGDEVR